MTMYAIVAARRCAGAVLAAGWLAFGPVPAAVAAEPAATTLVRCSGSFGMTVGGFVGDAQGSGDLTCTAPGRPDITSAEIRMRGSFSVSGSTVTTETQDTLTFNTGETTALEMTRTFVTNAGQASESGSGTTTSGAFHPATETESGSGTARSGGDVTIFTIDQGFTAELQR
ncbi:hypothetical protein [Streptomyces sp. NPDC046261]|uniref:hypothetical protein n=1 Tax=Streptomyces sp. NPDC046261 TaxID=3157200 RepID=UPI0033ED0E74